MPATITQTSKPLHPRALDTSGNNNHGTSYTGQALEFDGVADYVYGTLDGNPGAFGSQSDLELTIAFWYNPSDVSLTDGVVSWSRSGQPLDGSTFLLLSQNGSGQLRYYINHAPAYTALSTVFESNTWYRIVLTRTASDNTWRSYVNGVADSTKDDSGTPGSQANADAFYFGSGYGGYFTGMLSDCQVWNKPFTQSDVTYDYLNPEKLALDNSGTSLTYSDLKLWYPMNDSTRGKQINVMDGANTGLSDELVDNLSPNTGASPGWLTALVSSNGWVQDSSNPGTWTVSATGDGSFIIQSLILSSSVSYAYKLTYTITNSSGSGSAAQLRLAGGNSAFATQNIDGNDGTHTYYLQSNASKGNLQINENGFVGTISNISLKGINLKTHGTSVFYGDELWANDEALLSTDYGSELQDTTFIGAAPDSDLLGFTGASATGFTGVNTDAGVGANDNAYGKALSLVAGRVYKLSWTTAINAGDLSQQLDVAVATSTGGGAGDTATAGTHTAAGNYSNTFTAATTDTYYIVFRLGGNGAYNFTISNVSLKEVGSASELRTGSEIDNVALSNAKWYEITAQGSSADLLAKGNPIDDNSDWTAATGWAADAGNAKLTASGTTGLIYTDCTTSFANGDYLTITYTVTNVSGGTVRFIIGGNTNGTARDANGTYTESVTVTSKANDRLYFDGVSTFTGEISAITVTKSVDFTLFGAPDNNIGTKFQVAHTDGSSVPTMDSNNKAWPLDFGWIGYRGNTYSIVEEDDALRVKMTMGSVPTYSEYGLYIKFKGDNTEFADDLVIGRQYKFSCQLKVSSGDTVNGWLYDDGVTSTNLGAYDNTTFQTVTATFTAKHATNAYFQLKNLSPGDEVWISDFSIIEQGVATGWTEADAQPTIPQLGFQSYNQLAWFTAADDLVDINADTSSANASYSFWTISDRDGSGSRNVVFGHGSFHSGVFSFNWSGTSPITRIGVNKYVVWEDAPQQDDGKWHHWMVYMDVDDVTDSKLYCDGVAVAQSSTSNTGSTTAYSEGLNIGAEKASSPDHQFEGCITEFSWWNKELSLAEVQELYNDGEALDATLHSSVANLSGYWRNRGTGTWTDLSTNSNNGTPANISEYLILPEGINSRDTQGFLMNRTSTSGIQHTGAIAGSYSKFGYGTQLLSTPVSNASVECWFRSFGGTGASESYATFFGSRASNNILLCRNSTAGTVSGLYYLTSGGNQNNLDSTTNCFDDEWHHIAFTFDSGVGKLYIDGSLEATQDDTGDTIRMGSDTYYMETGADSVQGSRSFSGDVDDIAVYSTTLTVNQVARNYKAGKRRHKN
jgi:hypothetical protein